MLIRYNKLINYLNPCWDYKDKILLYFSSLRGFFDNFGGGNIVFSHGVDYFTHNIEITEEKITSFLTYYNVNPYEVSYVLLSELSKEVEYELCVYLQISMHSSISIVKGLRNRIDNMSRPRLGKMLYQILVMEKEIGKLR